jgi:hypothetical protein
MTMAKQISRVTQPAKGSEGTKKRTGRKPTYVLTLSDEEKEFLTSFIAKRNAPAVQVMRAKIALLANEGVRFCDIADELDVSTFRVSKWVRRFALFGVRSLGDAPRSKTPRTHGDVATTPPKKLSLKQAKSDGPPLGGTVVVPEGPDRGQDRVLETSIRATRGVSVALWGIF